MILLFFVIGGVVLFAVYEGFSKRLKEIQHKYPLAANFRQLPPKLLSVKLYQTIRLLCRSNIEWEREENNRQKYRSLMRYYPNGMKRVCQRYGQFSVEQIISHEQEIKDEETKFQQEKEREKEQERNAIINSLNSLHSAIIAGDIENEKAKLTIICLDTAIKSTTIDSDLRNKITEAIREFEKKYNEGILDDTLGTYYVDYEKPVSFVQDANWCYPVAKFPTKGTYFSPRRHRKIAFIGNIEATFQALSSYKLHIFDDYVLLPYEGCRPYELDIAIIDMENPSIRIDIEIDEPYTAITNTPIHYIGCGDDMRDMQLNNLGWIVVRFSEEQIYTAPQDCIAYIAQLIHCLSPDKTFPYDLLSGQQPDCYKRWTKIEAEVMASKKKRETYLPEFIYQPITN